MRLTLKGFGILITGVIAIAVWGKAIGGIIVVIFLLVLLPALYSGEHGPLLSAALMYVCLGAWLGPLVVGWLIAAMRASWSIALLSLASFILYPFATIFLFHTCTVDEAGSWTRAALALTPALVLNGALLAWLAKKTWAQLPNSRLQRSALRAAAEPPSR